MTDTSKARAAGVVLGIITLFAGASASAQVAVSGTVTWDVVIPVAGTVTFSGGSGFAQAPIDIGPSGFAGTYTTDLPPGDYFVSIVVGDCAEAGTGNPFACSDFFEMFENAPVTVPAGEPSVQFDFSPPPGFGQATASGTATVSGASVVGGTATFSYSLGDPSVFLFGISKTPIDSGGHYAAVVGSGEVNVSAAVLQTSCVITQTLFGSNVTVEAGGHAVLDVSGDALPPAPPPGQIQASFGATGFPDALIAISPISGIFDRQQDCGGGWNDPTVGDLYGTGPGVPAGTFLLHDFYDTAATDISTGTYQMIAAFKSHPAALGELTYRYEDQTVTVASGQTANLNYVLNPAVIRGPVQIDWGQFQGLAPDSPPEAESQVFFGAVADLSPGAESQAEVRWVQPDANTGVHTYDFSLTVDPTKQWRFFGASFTLFYLNGTFANILATPGISAVDQAPYLPPVTAGQILTYDFTNLLRFGTGNIVFTPRAAAVFAFLDGTSANVVAGQGVRTQYLHNFQFNPTVTGTSMEGRQTLTAGWFDPNFNQLTENLDFDLRPTETVRITESAPRLDNVQPVPGNVCVGNNQRITVSGTVSDPNGVSKVYVNGTSVPFNKNSGAFSANTEVPPGNSVLSVKAVDKLGYSMIRERPIQRITCP